MATDRGSQSPRAANLARHGVDPVTRPWRRIVARVALALFVAAVFGNAYQAAWSGALMSAFLLGYAWWQFRRLGLV